MMKATFAAVLLLFLASACGSKSQPPSKTDALTPLRGWFLAGPGQASFRAGADRVIKHSGASSGRLEAVAKSFHGAATLMQSVPADAWRGKRIRLSAFTRTWNVRGWAGLWMRVESRSGGIAFDNMQTRPLGGTTGWARHSVVLDVAKDATAVDFGLLQNGAGTSWIDDAAIEVVGKDVPTTDLDRRPRRIENPGFESKLQGWHLDGFAAPDFRVTLDHAAPHGGASSARLAPEVASPRGRAGVVQDFRADRFLGARVRVSAWVKGVGAFSATTLPANPPQHSPGYTYGQCSVKSSHWTRCAVVLDVPTKTDTIKVGLWTHAEHTAWIDDVAIETVAADTPLTYVDRRPTHLVNGDFEARPDSGSEPPGWFVSGGARDHYTATIDRTEHHSGKASVRFAPNVKDPGGYGTLMQGFAARDLRGNRVRMTTFVKGKGIDARGDVWVRVQAATSPGDGPGLGGGSCWNSGDFDWKPCTIVFDVPDDSDEIQLGLGLDGHGTIWLDDASFEVVDRSVPLTNPPMPASLQGGSFEGKLDRTWFLSGLGRENYSATLDPSEHANGASSLRLRAKSDSPKGYGTWMTSIHAAPYIGKRLRMTAKVKGRGVTKRGDVWLRVQAKTSPGDGAGLGGGRCKLSGTFDWKPCTIVFDVPARGYSIQLGVGLGGPGTLWLDDVRLQEVSTDVAATTSMFRGPGPENLGLEP